MKRYFLAGLLVLGLLQAKNLVAQTDSNPGKTLAIELTERLKSITASGDPSPEDWDKLSAEFDAYENKAGKSPATTNNLVILRKQQLARAKKFSDPGKYQALLQQLSTDPTPAVADMAKMQVQTLQRLEDLKTKPLDLEFTAVDGSKINVADLRGKVVLLDFWATWCPPCVAGAPELVEVYKKYHDQGFEIVGISLDQDKNSLLGFTKDKGMVWPQYFDGKGWDNTISKSFGIQSIPALWLFDKKGILVNTNGRLNTATQVEDLLKAP